MLKQRASDVNVRVGNLYLRGRSRRNEESRRKATTPTTSAERGEMLKSLIAALDLTESQTGSG